MAFSKTTLKRIEDHEQEEEERAVEAIKSDFFPSYFVALRTMPVLSVGEESLQSLVYFQFS